MTDKQKVKLYELLTKLRDERVAEYADNGIAIDEIDIEELYAMDDKQDGLLRSIDTVLTVIDNVEDASTEDEESADIEEVSVDDISTEAIDATDTAEDIVEEDFDVYNDWPEVGGLTD